MNEDNENIREHHKAFCELLSEAQSGNQASMGRLAVIVRERLYPFVFRTTLNHDLTEDMLQETLLTMVSQVTCLRDERRFWPWVFRIAWSKLQDNFRRRHRAKCSVEAYVSRASCPRSEGRTPSARPYKTKTGSDNLLEAAIQTERLQQLSEIVEQLSQQHRDILRLRYYEQLPYTEIATLTRTTPQKARARFHRAKKHLKAQMQDDTQQGMSVIV